MFCQNKRKKNNRIFEVTFRRTSVIVYKERCQNTINNICNQSTQTIDDYKTSLDELVDKVKPQEEYSKACKELQKIVDDKDYLAALRVINNKGLCLYKCVKCVWMEKAKLY